VNQFKEIKAEQLKGNPFRMIGKEWMLVTAKNEEKVNTMTASWGGLGVMWNKDVAFVVLRPSRYTKEFVDNGEVFTLSFYDSAYKKALGYLGSVSGRDEDKIAKSGLTLKTMENASFFEEANTVFICRKLFYQPFKENNFVDTSLIPNYYPEKDFHTLYIAEITKILVK
jgi:flavin reductase (DIM6/NTAB) family NADH-FMN oxidoreductase RutF